MKAGAASDFYKGMVIGILAASLVTLSLLYGPLLVAQWTIPTIVSGPLLDWLRDNLGLSVLPFSLILILFVLSLRRLEQRLAEHSPVHQVAQADQLTEVWIGLFFGVGVLWTAIGMRSALLYALGDGVEALADNGAAGLLERLVRGGILTALTTTIVGGAGGYLLRLYKTLHVGARLKHYYGSLDSRRAQRVESLLGEIRDGVRAPDRETTPCP